MRTFHLCFSTASPSPPKSHSFRLANHRDRAGWNGRQLQMIEKFLQPTAIRRKLNSVYDTNKNADHVFRVMYSGLTEYCCVKLTHFTKPYPEIYYFFNEYQKCFFLLSTLAFCLIYRCEFLLCNTYYCKSFQIQKSLPKQVVNNIIR